MRIQKTLNPGEKVLTVSKVKKKAGKFHRLYTKRLKGQPGRKSKTLFILRAAYSIYKEKNPNGKNIASIVSGWLEKNFSQYDPDEKGACFDLRNLYRWKRGRPFKEMQWEENWDDIKTSYEISCNGASKGEMSPRDIMRKHSISKRELENFTGFILSQHTGNKKTSNKFIFDRSDK